MTATEALATDLHPAVQAGLKRKFGMAILMFVGLKILLPFVIQLVVELIVHRHQEQRRKGVVNSDVALLLEETVPAEMMPETMFAVREVGA